MLLGFNLFFDITALNYKIYNLLVHLLEIYAIFLTCYRLKNYFIRSKDLCTQLNHKGVLVIECLREGLFV